jgi:hypothetical protein
MTFIAVNIPIRATGIIKIIAQKNRIETMPRMREIMASELPASLLSGTLTETLSEYPG